jgi:hypothetical protein
MASNAEWRSDSAFAGGIIWIGAAHLLTLAEVEGDCVTFS